MRADGWRAPGPGDTRHQYDAESDTESECDTDD
jgi:hypothetical protein